MAILTIQSEGKDTCLYEKLLDYPLGDEAILYLNARVTGAIRRYILLEFPLSDLPSGAIISAATLSLYYYQWGTNNPGGTACNVYKVRRSDWVEAEATWNSYKTGSNWGVAGCSDTLTDIDTSLNASTLFPANPPAWIDWDVKTIVEDAVNNSAPFEARLSLAGTANKLAYIRSKEYGVDTSLRPKLVIEYTVEYDGGLAVKHHYYQKIMR